MPWLNAHDYLKKKKREKGNKNFVDRQLIKAAPRWWGCSRASRRLAEPQLCQAPANQAKQWNWQGSHWSHEAEEGRPAGGRFRSATSQPGIIGRTSILASHDDTLPGFGFALCCQPTQDDCPESRTHGAAPRYATPRIRNPFQFPVIRETERGLNGAGRDRMLTSNLPTAAKPNAFFTANVAKFGLAQPLSTTQIRSVSISALNPSRTAESSFRSHPSKNQNLRN